MKGILIAGVFVAFAITVIDCLDCRQCSSIIGGINSCTNDIKVCTFLATDTAIDTETGVCVESSINSNLGGSQSLNYENYCSLSNCKDIPQADFTVHVSDAQQFHFASQCCENGPCSDDNNKEDSGTRNLINTQCPSCYGSNTEPCKEETQQCSEGEQCVHIIIQYGSGENKEELKGCSDISDGTCKALGESGKFGEFTFLTVNCTSATATPTTVTTTPTTVTTTPTTVTTTPDSSTSIKASFISSVFGSLLLLKLLF